MMYGYGNDMSWWMVIYSVFSFVLIALAIAAIALWLRKSTAPVDSSSGRRILEERFARGEIDDEEFHRCAKVLR